MKKKYIGWLQRTSNGEDNDLLGLDTGSEVVKLAEEISEAISSYGNFLTVRYFVSDKQISEEQAIENWTRELFGESEAEYGTAYSEYTGYLWTDEEINVGGHNLLDELKTKIHKYIILEIDFNKNELKGKNRREGEIK